MTTRLAVTGVEGFVGRHVAAQARRAGFHVIGIGRSQSADVPGVSEYVSADLAHAWPRLPDVDAIVHLAGLAAVGPSFDDPLRYVTENAAITINLCEELLRQGRSTRVVVASTGALYARSSRALTEDSPLSYSSPYAVSKATVENLLSYYGSRGLDLIVARPFNHIGPGQGLGFLVPDLIHRLRTLPTGEPLRTGNLDAERDYTDVRDVAAAYLMLTAAETLDHRIYNVASGRSRSGHEVLAEICTAMGREIPRVQMDRSRPIDVPRVVGDASRLREGLGWSPRHDFATSIADAVAAHV
ncbi:NAD-dependent epimerase/dehydratase family protein [Microbacterium sp. MEC084]|uniref:NAD-dependent epimerase/dehydratase family protein n=1 Tax=Microbacterium sp. MEC084 TaxID=1963027 RepID=UPI00106F32AC|nr:NAD-dependent epimerase/dehydratase family protein [Microbacterium sp. MEC084]MCD1269699.1 NAD-dependent epimerase/dehydratase family protein [Microbacterium sp. MEC084]